MPIRLTLSSRTYFLRSARWILATLAVIVVSTFAALALSGRWRPVNTSSAVSWHQPAGQTPRDIKVARLTLRPHGFEPKQFTRPEKTFYLTVENRSGIRNVNLRLDRVSGGRLREVQVKKRNQNWIEKFDLPPGSYRLSVAENPKWICDITITPQ